MNDSPEMKPVAPCTPAWITFMHTYFAVMDFFEFDILMNFSIPLVMSELPQKDPELLRRFAIHGQRSGFRDNPELAQKVILELVICRLVDNFQAYLADALSVVFAINPQLLNITTKDKVKIEQSYGCTTDAEIALYAPIHKVDCLSKSLNAAQILQFAEDELHVSPIITAEDKRLMTEVAAIRNVVVHNRGRANAKFLRDTGRTDLKVGDRVEWNSKDCSKWSAALHNVVDALDSAIVTALDPSIVFAHFAATYEEELKRSPFNAMERGNRLAEVRSGKVPARAILPAQN